MSLNIACPCSLIFFQQGVNIWTPYSQYLFGKALKSIYDDVNIANFTALKIMMQVITSIGADIKSFSFQLRLLHDTCMGHS